MSLSFYKSSSILSSFDR